MRIEDSREDISQMKSKSLPGRPSKYFFDKIEVGKVLIIENATPSDHKRVLSAAYQYRKSRDFSVGFLIRLNGSIITVTRFA